MIRVHVAVSHPSGWETVRTVLRVEHVPTHGRTAPGCHQLVPVYVGGRRVRFIPCARRLPRDLQCPGCAHEVVTTTVTTGAASDGVPSSSGR